MNPSERIIGKFGSIRRLARALGHGHPTTVQGWKSRGLIPLRHAPAIIAASIRENLDDPVNALDFIPDLECDDAGGLHA